MRTTIDIQLPQLHPDTDIDTIAAYLAAVLKEQTGASVKTHIIDSEYVNPIKLAQSLNMSFRRMPTK